MYPVLTSGVAVRFFFSYVGRNWLLILLLNDFSKLWITTAKAPLLCLHRLNAILSVLESLQ